MSLTIWDHTVLPATRHKWTHPALIPARGQNLIYRRFSRNDCKFLISLVFSLWASTTLPCFIVWQFFRHCWQKYCMLGLPCGSLLATECPDLLVKVRLSHFETLTYICCAIQWSCHYWKVFSWGSLLSSVYMYCTLCHAHCCTVQRCLNNALRMHYTLCCGASRCINAIMGIILAVAYSQCIAPYNTYMLIYIYKFVCTSSSYTPFHYGWIFRRLDRLTPCAGVPLVGPLTSRCFLAYSRSSTTTTLFLCVTVCCIFIRI